MTSKTSLLSVVLIALLHAAQALAADPIAIFSDRADQFGLSGEDIADIEITDDYISRHNGVRHVYLRQRIDGLPVMSGTAAVHLGSDGRVWAANSRFAANTARTPRNRVPGLEPVEALAVYAAERGLDFSQPPTRMTERAADSYLYSGGRMAAREIPVSLAWLEVNGRLNLVWEMAVDEAGRPDWYHAFIDAHDGTVLGAVNWTQEAAYRVFPMPLEHPGEGPDELVSDPADPIASPLGWHDTGNNQYTDTRGNNVFAQEDTLGNNSGGRRPDGGPELIFDFPIDLATQQPPAYEEFAVTNLFYWNNILHDVLWHYGFDEAAGNFQVNNFGLGGLGGDPVIADAQDGAGTNNATFSTPPDGSAPRMTMFVWTGSAPSVLRIDEPATIAGDYLAQPGSFGGSLAAAGLEAALELVDDGSADGELGCDALTGFTAGRIAVVRRGGCEFGLKALNAQNADAVATIVVNNTVGNTTISMGGGADGSQVTIPAVMVGNNDGSQIIDSLDQGVAGSLIGSDGPNLDRDSDLDAGVIAHEYGHGLSIRLTGGPSDSSCLQGNQQAGEGWSDFLGVWFTAKPEDTADTPRGVGSYLIFQENIPGAGIRPAPYTRNMDINPLTYDDLTTNTLSIPHGIGTVFNTVLWDMYWNLVDQYGFDENYHTGSGGNNIAMQLVVDSLKLHPCRPTFLDTRDALLLADQINYDGANQCLIWEAFARRGMGVDAFDGGSSFSLNVSEDFTLPESCGDLVFADRFESGR